MHPCLTCVEMRVDFSFKSDWNLLRRTAQIITKPTVSDYWVLFATDMRRVVFELLGLDNALLQQLRDLLYCVVPCIRLLLVIVGLIQCCCEPVETLCYLPALRHRMLATYILSIVFTHHPQVLQPLRLQRFIPHCLAFDGTVSVMIYVACVYETPERFTNPMASVARVGLCCL